ncbi:hypothetical protein Pmani_007437 [Petrolisthes manimaculis]|uniref:Uncharacterized protein n=1 Tax=Petrolisthes manimaculis TaxID=1843537 RepID=A0AAE1Q7U2_9EUCA|nr:hypothetical protein Pmani_007437 [Petrolisthes manimaculis]
MVIHIAVLLWPLLVHCEGRRVNEHQIVSERMAVTEQELVSEAEDDDEAMLLGEVVGQIVDQQLHSTPDCHQVLLTSTPHSPFVSAFLRQLKSGVMLIEVKKEKNTTMTEQQQQLQQLLPETVWGDMKTTCRTLVLHLTPDTNTTTLRMVEGAGLWYLPETRVVVVVEGDKGTDMQRILLHSTFRNTIHALYFAVYPSRPAQQSRRHFNLATTHTARSYEA